MPHVPQIWNYHIWLRTQLDYPNIILISYAVVLAQISMLEKDIT
jgi:hypothetical protein